MNGAAPGSAEVNLNAEDEVSFSIRINNARGQRIMEGDRLGVATHRASDASGNLLSLTDAISQTTGDTYNEADQRITEQYPDHIAGSVIGDNGFALFLRGEGSQCGVVV